MRGGWNATDGMEGAVENVWRLSLLTRVCSSKLGWLSGNRHGRCGSKPVNRLTSRRE
jgi:hypothetical protein